MRRLTYAQKARLEALQAKLTAAAERVEAEYDQLRDRIEAVEGEIESYIDERSAVWQHGPQGARYNDWLYAWQNPLDTMDADSPELPDTPDAPHPDDYPEEP